ncbi:c-type cytochrome [Rhabdothermincola salaria]|uniref:c-type cytochrome n=1 Tax=Rhabdothermincola salaria TaxID=2903142 RepID=UPI001E299FA4|nr:c-type cytochrome [Rhabdothermincola salaria]MCD9624259.1 cytochrome c [Rhabdothermincola salaria]
MPEPLQKRESWRHQLPLVVGAMAVAVLVLVGCGDDGTDNAAQSTSAERGAEVYTDSCASCHGSELEGTDQGPSLLSIVYEPGHHPDEAFRSAIANGAPQHHWQFGAMPPVEGLDPAGVDAVIGFIRSQQETQGFQR